MGRTFGSLGGEAGKGKTEHDFALPVKGESFRRRGSMMDLLGLHFFAKSRIELASMAVERYSLHPVYSGASGR